MDCNALPPGVPALPGHRRYHSLAAFGVASISLWDDLDLSTPSGRLMFQIVGSMAEFERALIQERVRAGLRNVRAKGRRLGHPD
jgi:DNA invertase Pin-like site-specific DNA recombinase